MPEHATFFGHAASFDSFQVVAPDFNALHKIEKTIEQSPQSAPTELIDSVPNTHLLIAKIDGDVLEVAATNGMRAKLFRGGKIINLLLTPGKIAGHIKNGDILVLGTEDFFNKIFSSENVHNPEELSLKLEGLEDKDNVAGLILKLDNVSLDTSLRPPLSSPTSSPRRPLFPSSFDRPKILTQTPSKRTLYGAGVILVFLISLIAFQLRGRNLEQRTQNAAVIEKQARDSLNQASNFAGLNDNMARNTLITAKNNFLTQAQTDFGPNWQKDPSPETKKLQAVLADLDNQLAQVSHIYNLSALDLFSDFSLLRADANITAASLDKNEIVALDSNNGAVYSLGTKSKTAAIVGGAADFKSNNYIDATADTVYVYTPSGIESINRTTNSVKVLLPLSSDFVKIRGLKTFGGNLYLLDTDGSQIWKYQGTDFGFSASPSAYLRAGSADFTNVNSFAIDGTIFVLSNSGNVANFSGGYAQDFSVSGLDKPLNNPTSIFTSDETNNLYILDSGNNRVVVLDKKGNYQAQYVSPDIKGSLILADETVKKVFLLSGAKVYSFDLK
ncbi:hypothetical protein M1403_02465 [Patescibacteria group bacterium]|nr:hypothetical protein [Patescibacteria group bacterium]